MWDHPNLQVLVGTAGLDRTFCALLLNGDRRRMIADFSLSDAEQEAVLAIEADSLPEFAQALLCWTEQHNPVAARTVEFSACTPSPRSSPAFCQLFGASGRNSDPDTDPLR